MKEKHYQEKLSEFVNHESSQDERQAIAEHLLQCAECRLAHDEIKFAAGLAAELKQSTAPEALWNKIEDSLGEKRKKAVSRASFAFFDTRRAMRVAAFLIVCGFVAAIYLGLSRKNTPEIAVGETPARNANAASPPQPILPREEIVSGGNENREIENREIENNPLKTVLPETYREIPGRKNPAGKTAEPAPKNRPAKEVRPKRFVAPSWNVEALAGMPKIGDSFEIEKLAVGEVLETDANSRARVEVADIGNVEIAPNSRVKLVDTKPTEHRLSLERGQLHARIFAPPRLFIVDTPSAVAIDLGCEYTLEVDAEGNGKLHVTGGFVALERGAREAIVPAGAIALTKKGKGVGTPFSEDAAAELRAALYEFDFENGGDPALETIVETSGPRDSVTLWHLLSRVERPARGKIFDALAAHVKPPAAVTRDGILRLDKKMLGAWWTQIETIWFE